MKLIILQDDIYQVKAESNFYTYLIVLLILLIIVFSIVYYFKKKKKIVENPRNKLTKQENKILDLILENKTKTDISNLLFIEVSTVKTHTNNIYRKLNISSKDDLKAIII